MSELKGPRRGRFQCWFHKQVKWCEVYRVYGSRRKNVLCRVDGTFTNYRICSYLINFDNVPNFEEVLKVRFKQRSENEKRKAEQQSNSII